MNFCIDIDRHIIFSDNIKCTFCGRITYKPVSMDADEIELINKKYDEGHTIILWTGRGWDIYDLTERQLKDAGVKYHRLICGKPLGIYIDKDSFKSLRDFDNVEQKENKYV